MIDKYGTPQANGRRNLQVHFSSQTPQTLPKLQEAFNISPISMNFGELEKLAHLADLTMRTEEIEKMKKRQKRVLNKVAAKEDSQKDAFNFFFTKDIGPSLNHTIPAIRNPRISSSFHITPERR